MSEHDGANNTLPGTPPGTVEVQTHRSFTTGTPHSQENDLVAVLYVGSVSFPQLPGPSAYYRLSFTTLRPSQLQPLPGMEMPPVQEQVGIDVPIHLGATERGMTGITVESLLAVCGDVLEREGNVEAAAAVYAALAAASQRSGAEPEAQA